MKDASDPKVFKQLQEADWEVIGKRLLAFAIWRAQMYWGFIDSETVLPKGFGIEDVVQEIIDKTLRGQRRWNPERGALEPWLKDQVKSELDALAKSWVAKHEQPVRLDDQGEEMWDITAIAAPERYKEQTSHTVNPEALLEEEEQQKEDEQLASRLVSAVYEASEGIPQLVDIIDAVQNGIEFKPRYLADELGVPIDEIYNRVRRLRRRALTARKDNENG